MRRILSIALVLCMMVTMIPSVAPVAEVSAADAKTYDADAAVNYAKNHWNDGKGLCAEFVSDCLTAGGISVSILTTRSLRNYLVNNGYATDYLITKTQGTRIKMSDYSDKIAPGDVIINYCVNCDVYPHVMLVSGTNSSGQVTYYAHNNAANNKAYWNGSDGYRSHGNGSHTFHMYVLHMKNATSGGNIHAQPVHVHSFTTKTESSHPHNVYNVCSCGTTQSMGASKISTCTQCYPVGNLSLRRSVEKAKGTATFYRNNVTNANKYTLQVKYNSGSLYGEYNMTNDSYTVSGLTSGEYYAVLYAKNTTTGEQRSVQCDSFKIIEKYDVAFNANGGKNAPSNQVKYEDIPLTLSAHTPTREGHIFKGWAKSKNAITAEYAAGGTYDKNAKVTLYAVWEPEVYTVTFDVNGGIGSVESVKVTYGNSIKMPNSIVKEYSYLKGWSQSKTATTPEYTLGGDWKIKQNTTLYAIWGDATWAGEVSNSLQGSGTEADPYLISSSADLAYLANKVNTQTSTPKYEYYKMTENINLTYSEWVPIGVYGNTNQYFCGSFDGNGFTISDMYITKPNSGYVGLFGYAKNSEIRNLTLTGAIESISTTLALNAGGVVGYANKTNLDSISVKYFNIGGISGSTSAVSYMGTVAGNVAGGYVTKCKSEDCSMNLKSGLVTAGMLLGKCDSSISDCKVTSTSDGLFSSESGMGEFTVGGLCGELSGSAEKCSVYAPYYSNNLITTTYTSVGGLVGSLSGNLKVCSAQFNSTSANTITSTGKGSIYIGGLAGVLEATAKITDCKFDGKTINGTATSRAVNIGGLIGYSRAKKSNTISVSGGQSLSRSALPAKSGYKATWYTDSSFTTPYDFSQTVTSDLTLYAKWEKGDDTPKIWDGTSKEPAYNAETKTYTITNGEELAWVANVVDGNITSGKNFPADKTFSGYTIELADDIYLNDVSNWENLKEPSNARQWNPIGDENNVFSGTFDGKNRTVYGLYNNVDEGYIALFAQNSGTIKNLKISDAYIVGRWNVAAVIGVTMGDIINCHNVDNVRICGRNDASGITSVNKGDISECGNGANVYIGSDYGEAGGITGQNNGIISKCYNNASIKGGFECSGGGIVGYSNGGSIKDCYNTGSVYGYSDGGGIAGEIRDGSIFRCYNSGSIDAGYYNYAGGIAGKLGRYDGDGSPRVQFCYNISDIVDGLVGAYNDGFLNFCYYTNARCKATGSYVESQCYKLTTSEIKQLSKVPYLNNGETYFATKSGINNGYPYLISLEETYKTYSVNIVMDDGSIINRAFVNVEGTLSGTASVNSHIGSVIGNGSSGSTTESKNIVSLVDSISVSTTGSSNKAYAGKVIGYNSGAHTFTNTYYNSEMTVSSSTDNINSAEGTARSKKTMNVPFYTNVMGLTPYTSLANLAEDDKAVWVLKNGELPELYYNCLNDITVSDKITNGKISVDKAQAVDGETVTITATPEENYILNTVYVNGEVKDGTQFTVSGDSEVYATFTEKIAEYTVSVEATQNVSGTLENVDTQSQTPELMSVSFMASGDNGAMTANDGEEIKVNAVADEDFAVESIYVNGEEIAGESFIVSADTVVSMEVTSINTDYIATTNDAEDVGVYFATLSGSVTEFDGAVRYIRYWRSDAPSEVFTTEIQEGSGTYSVAVEGLEANTEYSYQMTENGEVKTFTTLADAEDTTEPEVDDEPVTSTVCKISGSYYSFAIGVHQPTCDENLYVATYNSDGKLLGITSTVTNGGALYRLYISNKNPASYAKVFVLKMDSLSPVGNCEIVNITQ